MTTHLNTSKHIKTHPNTSEHFQTHPNTSKQMQTHQNRQACGHQKVQEQVHLEKEGFRPERNPNTAKV